MSWAIWITGIPGSGKSALARAAADELRATGERVRVLELDEIRKTLTPEPRYTDAERDLVYRALAYMAWLLTDAGVPVIVDATAHRRAWRDLARAAISRFAEVQLVCRPEIARERERARADSHAPRGIYERAGQPGATVPGVDVVYEPALAPELVLDSAAESVPAAAVRVAELGRRLASAIPAEPAARPPGWAIWITGRPGSGKTSVAGRVAGALTARAVPVRVLDLATARRWLLPGDAPSAWQQEIAHRALGYAAKLLTEAGIAVIIDATAPRRAWRQAARALIPCFAEVQLVCPVDVCVERERAVRWGLGAELGDLHRGRPTPGPDLALDYEESLRPELVLHTGLHDADTAAEQVLFLAHRLRAVSVAIESP